MSKIINIIKRDGRTELLKDEKYHEHVNYAVEGIEGVFASAIETKAKLHIVDGTKSSNIQIALIKASVELTTEESPNYQKTSARLLNQHLRKSVYNGSFIPDNFYDKILSNVKAGVYDGEYLNNHYSSNEIKEILKFLDYDKDDNFLYGGLKKTIDNYLIRQYDQILETPQEMYLMINIFAFAKYKNKYDSITRLKWIKIGYDALSDFEVSLPTPIMIQLRSSFKKFISCALVPLGDNKNTIANASQAIYILVAGGAGLGIMPGDIRGLGADIDNGRIKHTGTLPILKGFEKSTKAFTQPTRDGSTTAFYPFFHMEIETFMVLGNAKGVEETRVRDMDHAIMFNDYFFERYKKDEDITLFYMNDIEDINSYLGDYHKFKKIYEEAERTIPVERTKKISAKKLFDTFNSESMLQHREYSLFMDNVQRQGPWKIPIKESNLCLEILVPNFPIYDIINIKRNIIFDNIEDRTLFYQLRKEMYFHQNNIVKLNQYLNKMKNLYTFNNADLSADVNESLDYDYFSLDGRINPSEIGVCIIAGINLGNIKPNRLPIISEYLVRLEEELIDYMDYDLDTYEKAAKMRRTIGIGFSDVFHLLAKNKVKYNTSEGRQLIHDTVEICAYHMTKTSIQLAEDFGACQLVYDTKYSDGLFPKDLYNKNVDQLVIHNNLGLDWEFLKIRVLKFGIRHSTIMANAPFGSSSIPSDSTPGIEPPRKLVNRKSGVLKIVPEMKEFGEYYTTAWSDEFNNIDYLKFVACLQKFMDQTLSTNRYMNLLKYKDNKYPKSLMIKEILTAKFYGIKSLYYINTISKDITKSEEEISKKEEKEKINSVKIELEESDESLESLEDPLFKKEDIVKNGCSSGGCTI